MPIKKHNDNGRLKALSFFSGAMGLDLGLEQAGIDVVLACEFDKWCQKTISHNKPEMPLIDDINKYSANEILELSGLRRDEVDLIVGGPPCQAFSTAGKRQAFNDTRGNVFLKFIDLIGEIKPKYAVIENVRGLLSAPLRHRPHAERGGDKLYSCIEEMPGGALNHVIQMLRSFGYGVSFTLYNSANFGVPQVRERVIIMCSRDGSEMPFLKATHSNNPEFNLPPWRTLRDAIADLDFDAQDHINFPDSRVKYYNLLKEGQYWKNLPSELQREAMGNSFFSGGGKTGFYRKLAWDKPSCTLVTNPAMPATDICHPERSRPLTVSEYKRIQQFPDHWVIMGSFLQQYRQVGNAVPVGLGRAIGDLILAYDKGQALPAPQDFPYSRYRGTDHRSWLHSFSGSAEKVVRQLQLFE